MPNFAAVMTKTQIKDVVDYIEGLPTVEEFDPDAEIAIPEERPVDRTQSIKPASYKDSWKVVVSHNQDRARNMLDGVLEPRWESNAHMRAGMWVAIELPEAKTLTGVVLDAAASAGDYPRGYEFFVSDDGKTWKKVTEGEGTKPLVKITFPAVETKHFKILLTKDAEVYWSIHELDIIEKK